MNIKTIEQERNDWIIIIIILVIGFICVIAAGQLALRFSPNWRLDTDMESRIELGHPFLTPNGFVQPVDPSILTQPAWINVFLTPGASFVTGTQFPALTSTVPASPATIPSMTITAVAVKSPTSTLVYFPATRTATSNPVQTVPPASTRTPVPTSPVISIATQTFTATAMSSQTSTHTSTPTPTFTSTSTATSTATATATHTSTHTPNPIPTDPTPGEIGTTPDNIIYNLPAGGTLTLGINVVANGDANFDLVYYERANPTSSGIFLDWAIVEISDGTNWYTIFNWGNNTADSNSNMNFNILPNPQVPEEPDQRDISTASLYNSTGIAIDVDAIVPAGTYSYIRFSAPAGDVDGKMEIDAIEVLP